MVPEVQRSTQEVDRCFVVSDKWKLSQKSFGGSAF